MTIYRICAVCGAPFTPTRRSRSRCAAHAIPPRTGTYSRNAALVRANAIVCQICGNGFTKDDLPVTDHVVPRGLGASDDLSNLLPAHRSCNGRKGGRLGYHGGLYDERLKRVGIGPRQTASPSPRAWRSAGADSSNAETWRNLRSESKDH